ENVEVFSVKRLPTQTTISRCCITKEALWISVIRRISRRADVGCLEQRIPCTGSKLVRRRCRECCRVEILVRRTTSRRVGVEILTSDIWTQVSAKAYQVEKVSGLTSNKGHQ